VFISYSQADKSFVNNLAAGDPGPQGPPGEVSQAQLDAAISGKANNPSGIAPYAGTFSDPPPRAEMQDFAAWTESLRAALVR
jgi:hypothetical protein